MTVMDGFEGRCWLDWWANSITLLASAEVAVVIAPTRVGWDAHGHLISASDEDRDGFAFLCNLDPVFAGVSLTPAPVLIKVRKEALTRVRCAA
jgi:hypothetical protein